MLAPVAADGITGENYGKHDTQAGLLSHNSVAQDMLCQNRQWSSVSNKTCALQLLPLLHWLPALDPLLLLLTVRAKPR
jgi:hypothetical protein